jgi:peptidoglycan/xylan/chitin deacetylase (PgdA/CDA1 family)
MRRSTRRADIPRRQATGRAAGQPAAGLPRNLPVLRYHSVSHHSPETAAPGSVAASVLEEQLTFLVASGWQLLGVTEALSQLAEDAVSRVVALTFDDGLLDFLNAFDILEKLNARATLYVPTSGIGMRVSRWDRGHSRLCWEALAHLSAAGVEIGSMSVHARPLDVRPDAVVGAEVVASKRLLEARLSVPIESFCYPGGLASTRVRHAVAAAGYSNACAVEHLWFGHQIDVLGIPRVRVRSRTTPEKLEALITGSAPSGVTRCVARTARPAWRMTSRPARRAARIALPGR